MQSKELAGNMSLIPKFKRFKYDNIRIDILHGYDPIQNRFYLSSGDLYFDATSTKNYLILDYSDGQQIFEKLIYFSQIMNRWSRALIMMTKLIVFFDSIDLVFDHVIDLAKTATHANTTGVSSNLLFKLKNANFKTGH